MPHDDLCPVETDRLRQSWCQCDLIARVRADEREQRDDYWQGRLESAWIQLDEAAVTSLRLAGAEAVAARLVEVICRLDARERGPWNVVTLACGHRCFDDEGKFGCPTCERERVLRAQIAADIEALPQWTTWGPDGSLDDADVIDRQAALSIARGES